MKRNYSVFPGNVGSCSDRCCAACGKAYYLDEQLFSRAASVGHFTQAKWKQGTLSPVDPAVRKQAIAASLLMRKLLFAGRK